MKNPILALAVLSVMFIARPASAYDRYAAAFCEATSGSIVATSDSRARNGSSTATAEAICPMRHSFTSLQNHCFDVRLVDNHPSTRASCTVVVRTATSVLYSLPATTAAASSSPQVLYLDAWVNTLDSIATRCTLGGGTTNAIWNYAVDATCPPM